VQVLGGTCVGWCRNWVVHVLDVARTGDNGHCGRSLFRKMFHTPFFATFTTTAAGTVELDWTGVSQWQVSNIFICFACARQPSLFPFCVRRGRSIMRFRRWQDCLVPRKWATHQLRGLTFFTAFMCVSRRAQNHLPRRYVRRRSLFAHKGVRGWRHAYFSGKQLYPARLFGLKHILNESRANVKTIPTDALHSKALGVYACCKYRHTQALF
jgi:hypothetical protein